MNAPRAYLYKLPLAGGGFREGMLLRDGERWGDAAPLPGWSRETLDDVRSCLDRRAELVPASLRCALEALEQDWTPLRNEVPLNALLDGNETQILAGALRAFREGCRCLKIKTSGVDLARLPDLLSDITRETGCECQLRLDPNRAWSFDETLRLAEKLSHFPIEYLEEPLADSSRLPELIQRSACPIALDETLREIDPAGLWQFQGAAALVLKPTL
ncbi:MAG: enolase C-terminal domain-like protein, partial [Spartobacteria bacterium]